VYELAGDHVAALVNSAAYAEVTVTMLHRLLARTG